MDLNIDAIYHIVEKMDTITQWVFSQTCKEYQCFSLVLNENPIGLAAKEGYLKIVQWLHKNKYKLDTNIMAIAASGNNLEIVKYLHKKQCPWNKLTIARAIMGGNVDILEYAIFNHCVLPYRNDLLKLLGMSGKPKVLDFMMQELRPMKRHSLFTNVNLSYP